MEGQRRRRRRNRSGAIAGVVIVLLLLAAIGLVLFIILGGKGCGEPKLPTIEITESAEEETQSTEAPPSTAYEDVLATAERMAGMYDYDNAMAYVQAQVPTYESDQLLKAFIQDCKAKKEKLIKWADNTQITHIFFHSLVADTSLAWNCYKASDYNEVMTTIDEFNKMMQIMYDEGYVLVSLSDIAKIVTQADGTAHMTWQPIYLPKGKTPFVLSVDDVSYYEYMNNTGFATKLIIDENGKVRNEMATYKSNGSTYMPELVRDANGAPIVESVKVGAYDVVPILDDFIDEHPDFSYHGAKGIIALTGYNGILGYKTSEIAYGAGDPNYPSAYEYKCVNIEQERVEAKRVADAMKANGWKFASHTWGHMDMGKVVQQSTGQIVSERFKRDTGWWLTEVAPLIGGTDTILYAYGADIGTWRSYPDTSEAYLYLKSVGFDYFCNVDSTRCWVQMSPSAGGDGYLRQGRRNLDGQMMFKSMLYPEKGLLSDLFDAKLVFDRQRPLPVNGVTVPEGFNLSTLFD